MTSFKLCLTSASLGLLLASCDSEPNEVEVRSQAEVVLDSAIAFHGGDLYNHLDLSFSFRERVYDVVRQGGKFEYSCTFRDSSREFYRKLTNDGYSELVDGVKVKLFPKDSSSHASSVNSVIYFALLPGPLNDPAVEATYEGKEEIEGKTFYKIELRFKQEGGGEDFEDVYLYWFDLEDYSMDYLAYSFMEDNGGTRFRKAYNSRRINGLVVQDYLNFKGPSTPDSLPFISEVFKRGELDTLSKIEISRIRVDQLN